MEGNIRIYRLPKGRGTDHIPISVVINVVILCILKPIKAKYFKYSLFHNIKYKNVDKN
jgi:hypothetical protein